MLFANTSSHPPLSIRLLRCEISAAIVARIAIPLVAAVHARTSTTSALSLQRHSYTQQLSQIHFRNACLHVRSGKQFELFFVAAKCIVWRFVSFVRFVRAAVERDVIMFVYVCVCVCVAAEPCEQFGVCIKVSRQSIHSLTAKSGWQKRFAPRLHHRLIRTGVNAHGICDTHVCTHAHKNERIRMR